MPRVLKPLAIGCLALTTVIVAAIGYLGWQFLFVQEVRILHKNGGVVVDLQSLGEYQANLSRLKLSDPQTGRVLWEAKAKRNINPVWTIPLIAGENPAHPDILSWSEILVPENEATFVLKESTKYVLETWSYKNQRESHRVVEFEISDGGQP